MPYFWVVARGWCERHLLDSWRSLLVRALSEDLRFRSEAQIYLRGKLSVCGWFFAEIATERQLKRGEARWEVDIKAMGGKSIKMAP